MTTMEKIRKNKHLFITFLGVAKCPQISRFDDIHVYIVVRVHGTGIPGKYVQTMVKHVLMHLTVSVSGVVKSRVSFFGFLDVI